MGRLLSTKGVQSSTWRGSVAEDRDDFLDPSLRPVRPDTPGVADSRHGRKRAFAVDRSRRSVSGIMVVSRAIDRPDPFGISYAAARTENKTVIGIEIAACVATSLHRKYMLFRRAVFWRCFTREQKRYRILVTFGYPAGPAFSRSSSCIIGSTCIAATRPLEVSETSEASSGAGQRRLPDRSSDTRNSSLQCITAEKRNRTQTRCRVYPHRHRADKEVGSRHHRLDQ